MTFDKSTFGIIGDFAGDEALWQEVQWCLAACSSSSDSSSTITAKPAFHRLVVLLGRLPHRGRKAVVRLILAKSPHRDEILLALWGYCFEPGSAEEDTIDPAKVHVDSTEKKEANDGDSDEYEFVLIAYPESAQDDGNNDDKSPTKKNKKTAPQPLNLSKYHIFHAVIILMGMSGAEGAHLSRRYLQETASTRYRAKILIQAATCFSQDDFSNQELWEFYQSSSQSVQKKLREICQTSTAAKKGRQGFLQLVYETDKVEFADLFYFLHPDYVALHLPVLYQDKSHYVEFRQWGKHGDTYLSYLRGLLQQAANDQLRLGRIWQSFILSIETKSLQPRHAYELHQLLETHVVCEIYSQPSTSISTYLTERSRSGQDVSQFEDHVRRIVVLVDEVAAKLTPKQKIHIVNKLFRERDLVRFPTVFASYQGRETLPYQEYFSSLTSEQFWSYISKSKTDPFWNAIAGPRPQRQKLAFLQDWAEMHFRCPPSSLPNESKIEFYGSSASASDLWKEWYSSCSSFCVQALPVITELGKACDSWPHHNAERLASDSKAVLDIVCQGYTLVSPHVDAETAVVPLFQTISALGSIQFKSIVALGQQAKKSGRTSSVAVFAEACIRLVCERLLPRLNDYIRFDLADQGTYATMSRVNFFASKMKQMFFIFEFSETFCSAAATVLLDVTTRLPRRSSGAATMTITKEPPPSKKLRIVQHNFSLFDDIKSRSGKIMALLLESSRDMSSFDSDLAGRLWKCVRETTDVGIDPCEYLRQCQKSLPKHLVETEKIQIIKISRKYILSKVKEYPAYWKGQVKTVAEELAKLRSLEAVVDSETVSPKLSKYLIEEFGDFTNETTQQKLKSETYAQDADARRQGLMNWLTRACQTDSCSEIAEALSFFASRVKDESGINRRPLFLWLETAFTPFIVQRSLADHSSDSAVHTKLCTTILDMQKSDMNKLDSVGRHVCFPKLGRSIIQCVFDFDPHSLNKERREMWIDCAIEMDWIWKSASGEDALYTFQWPMDRHGALKTASWVSRESLESLYPASSPSTPFKLSKLGGPSSQDLVERFSPDNVFGPKQCVEMLEHALEKVWKEKLSGSALRLNGSFPEDEKLADAWLRRILVLYQISGQAWQEVDLLVSTYDHVVTAASREEASDRDLRFAFELFQQLRTIHSGNFSLDPKMAYAADRIFRNAVKTNRAKLVQKLFSDWAEVYMDADRRSWDSPVDHRMTFFIDCYAEYEPDSWRPELSKSQAVLRECELARELLDLSPSALLLPEVREILLSRRQDIVLKYLRDPLSLSGAFQIQTGGASIAAVLDEDSEPETRTINEVFFATLSHTNLLACHAQVSVDYASHVRAESCSSKLDLKSRVEAIGKFMSAPSTQHNEVLDALQNNLDEAVRQSLINRIFDLDSPWHILGHLLETKRLAKSDQRTTSALLGYVAQHVHIDKVVRVVSLLLKSSRRYNLGFQLHKTVLRMLFDADTEAARALLAKEWKYTNLHEGIRVVLIEKCTQRIGTGKTGWELDALLDLAGSSLYSAELKFHLFAPSLPRAPSLSIPTPNGVEKDDTLELYRRKAPSTFEVDDTPEVAARFRSILETLEQSHKLENDENGSLQILAKLKKWSFSIELYGCVQKVDLPLLSEMAKNVIVNFETTPTPSHPQQLQHVSCARWLGQAVFNLLNTALVEQEYVTTVDGVRHRMAREEMVELVETSTVALRYRECIRSLLDMILDTPVRQKIHRQLSTDLLEILVSDLRYSPLFSELMKPFAEDFRVLQNDSRRIGDVCRDATAGTDPYRA